MLRRFITAALAAAVACALFATLGSASVNVAQSGWSWSNPTPQGNSLNSIDFVQGRGFAAGDAGTVLRTDDGGSTWTGLATGTAAELNRLQVLDPQTLIVLDQSGCVLRRSDDGGTTFHKIFIVAEQNCPQPVQSFNFFDRQTGYLLLRDGSVLRTTDAGQTFARQTAIPGTPASNSQTSNSPVDLVFTSADTGIAFVNVGNGSGSSAYSTTDAGISWKPIDNLPPAHVSRLWFLDSKVGFAVGPQTLLATEDGGKTWTSKAIGATAELTGIRCSDKKTCILTVSKGDKLLRTSDGGDTATEITPSSQGIFAAAFASPTRVAAVGANGATVISSDAGVNYTPVSTALSGAYSRLRPGSTPSTVWAFGPRGSIAHSTDGGMSWREDAVPTSREVIDVSFPTATTGYALDATGSLFKSTNAGVSWQTLDTGTTSAPKALSSPAPDVVVLIGPRGIRRGDGATQPTAVGNAALRRTAFDALVSHPNLLAAYGFFAHSVYLSTDQGKNWKAVKLPKKLRIQSIAHAVDFVGPKTGYVVDTGNRIFKTTNAGKSWTQLLSVGTSDIKGITMSDASNGFAWLFTFTQQIPDRTVQTAFVLRTSDGGKTWRPQGIARGGVNDVLATTPSQPYAIGGLQGYALLDKGWLFSTNSGGDAGTPTSLTLKTQTKLFTKKAFKKSKGRVTVSGTLPGAVGGEQIVVSRRDLTASGWSHQLVTAGANGGSFTTSWKIRRSSIFVAQWAGDSGRRGAGSTPLQITVKTK